MTNMSSDRPLQQSVIIVLQLQTPTSIVNEGQAGLVGERVKRVLKGQRSSKEIVCLVQFGQLCQTADHNQSLGAIATNKQKQRIVSGKGLQKVKGT